MNLPLNLEKIVAKNQYQYITDPLQYIEDISKRFSELDQLEDFAVILNTDSDIVFLNQRGSDLLGIDSTKAIGLNWIENFIPKDQRLELEKSFDVIMQGFTEPFANYNNDIKTLEGERVNMHWFNQFIYSPNDDVIATFSTGVECALGTEPSLITPHF